MSLKASLVLLDSYGSDVVFDEDCGCYFSRNASGELTLSREDISYTLEELVAGPCAGYYHAALDERINAVFSEWVRNQELMESGA